MVSGYKVRLFSAYTLYSHGFWLQSTPVFGIPYIATVCGYKVRLFLALYSHGFCLLKYACFWHTL
jgi:hypothetical protein